MIRVIVLMTLVPDAGIRGAVIMLAGDLAGVPWSRPWVPASERALGDWRNALGPEPLEELQWVVLRASHREHRDRDWRAVVIGRTRPLKTGSIDRAPGRRPGRCSVPGPRTWSGRNSPPGPQGQVRQHLPPSRPRRDRHQDRPRRHHPRQHASLTSVNTAHQAQTTRRRPVDPAVTRHDTPAFSMPGEQKLPTVTKTRNYAQTPKCLKPMALRLAG
jgi:hypothetical protein